MSSWEEEWTRPRRSSYSVPNLGCSWVTIVLVLRGAVDDGLGDGGLV